MPFQTTKRVLDFGLALGLVPMLLATGLSLVLLNTVFNPGPLLFSQPRMGKDGVPFRLVKFRTLSAEGRATAFAHVLRRLRIDELPQTVSILMGKMSFVGPRPLCLKEVARFEAHIPGFTRRHSVRPGLTGLAQIRQGHTTGVVAARRKLAWDRLYLKNQSLRFDAFVVLATLRCVASQHSSPAKAPIEMDPLRIMQ